MKISMMLGMFVLAGIPHIAGGGQDNQISVTVYVQKCFGGDASLPLNFAQARAVASGIFATVGVRIRWRSSGAEPQDTEAIVIDITSNTPQSFHRGAWAYAQVYEGVHIRIFYDRLNRPGRRVTGVILAHVLVHEITHILEGVDRHSQEGIMKARWTDKDLTQMSQHPLPFDSTDVWLIRTGLAKRVHVATSVISPETH